MPIRLSHAYGKRADRFVLLCRNHFLVTLLPRIISDTLVCFGLSCMWLEECGGSCRKEADHFLLLAAFIMHLISSSLFTSKNVEFNYRQTCFATAKGLFSGDFLKATKISSRPCIVF